jgi:hypothetical protein
MSKATDELEDALTLALGKYIRAVVGEAVETALADQEPVEDEEEEKPKKKTSAERRKEAASKLDKSSVEEEEEDESDEDEEDSDEDEEDSDEDEVSEADLKDAVRAALKIAERSEVIGLMKKHGKSDKASGVKPELRGAVIDALAKLTKKGSKGK